jgi:carbonic anhydrase/acetyltransferase-like protein (isoleucine patch superfamily)
VLQGCTVEDEAFVGIGATLLDGVVVEKHGMVAAGALVRQNTRIPCGEVEHTSSTVLCFGFLIKPSQAPLPFLFHRLVSPRQGFLVMMEPQ